MIEYKKLGLSVGDKVFLDLTKAESSGVWFQNDPLYLKLDPY